MDVREKYVMQKVSRKEKTICPNCIHHNLCIAENNQPCFECNRFIDAHGVTVQEWIPVTEPPKERGRYYTNRKLFGSDHVEILQYRIDSGGGYWSYYDDEYGVRLVQDVTHWMPQPTPPKGE